MFEKVTTWQIIRKSKKWDGRQDTEARKKYVTQPPVSDPPRVAVVKSETGNKMSAIIASTFPS